MKHLEQEQLVAHYYGEAGKDVARHIADCYECRTEFANLQRTLSAVTAPEAPARGPEYGAQVWNRVRGHLPQAAPKRQWWLMPQRWAAIGAMAALIVIAFVAGRRTAAPPNIAGTNPSSQVVKERVLMVALGDHLERSQVVLLEVAHADNPSDIGLVREQADELLDSNRLYRQAANKIGDHQTADVLDQLERVLLQVAHSTPDEGRAQLQQLRQQIESQGLLFKVRVIHNNFQNEIRPEPKPGTEPITPPNPSKAEAIAGSRTIA